MDHAHNQRILKDNSIFLRRIQYSRRIIPLWQINHFQLTRWIKLPLWEYFKQSIEHFYCGFVVMIVQVEFGYGDLGYYFLIVLSWLVVYVTKMFGLIVVQVREQIHLRWLQWSMWLNIILAINKAQLHTLISSGQNDTFSSIYFIILLFRLTIQPQLLITNNNPHQFIHVIIQY